ncbi:MAG: hypothetical protein ACFFE3_05640, partial [Candidatus Thorarchaeota archaeon]
MYKYDTDDNPLNGWTINLIGEEDQPDMNAVTAGGQVTFTVEWPGDYYVEEVLQTGWTLISPTENQQHFTVVGGGSYSFTYVNFEWISVSGHKYEYIEGFSDEFDFLDYSKWQPIYSYWHTVGGVLENSQSTFGRIVALPTMGYTDYSFEADVQLQLGPIGGFGLIFRESSLSPSSQFYSFQYHMGALRLYRHFDLLSYTDLALPVNMPLDYGW